MRVKILLIAALVVIVGIVFFIVSKNNIGTLADPSPSKSPKIMSCVVSGQMQPASSSKKEGFESIGRMVRLHYAVESLDDCKKMTIDYCKTRLDEGYIPDNLVMKFRADPDTETVEQFQILKSCGLGPVRPVE